MAVNLYDLLKEAFPDNKLIKKLSENDFKQAFLDANNEIGHIIHIFSEESSINFNKDNFKAILDKISEADTCGSLDKLMETLYNYNQVQQKLKNTVKQECNHILNQEFSSIKSKQININDSSSIDDAPIDTNSIYNSISNLKYQLSSTHHNTKFINSNKLYNTEKSNPISYNFDFIHKN